MVWMVKTDKLLCEVLVFQVFELIFSTSFSSELQWVPSNKDGGMWFCYILWVAMYLN